MKNEMPSALVLLRDWSIWLVGLQTGALGLVSFVAGKDTKINLNTRWVRWSIYCFAASIVAATFVLSAIPDIAKRIAKTPDVDFYQEKMFVPFQWLPLSFFTMLQHYLFLFGLGFFVFAIIKAIKTSEDAAVDNSG